MTPSPPLQRDHAQWADEQVQQALSVLLPERANDWFEDHSEAFRERLARMSKSHLDYAISLRRSAHFHRRFGNMGGFKRLMAEALHDMRMARHYARRIA